MISFCIMVPFYNEQNTIVEFAKKLQHSGYSYLLINDGSTDNSVNKLRKNKIVYYGYNQNKGKGYAIKYATKNFVALYDYYLIMDSDDQHSLVDVPNFIKMAEKSPETGILLGNRLSNPKNMPLLRLLANKFMSLVISLMIGRIGAIKDSQCGFRLIKKEVFDIPTKENRFAYETEVLIKASKAGYKIKNVPIHCIYNKDRISKISPVKDCIRWVKCLWRLINEN